MLMDNGSVLAGCSTTCRSDTLSNGNHCFGIGCCQTTIPDRFKSYSINLTDLEMQGENGDCGSAALVDKTSYDEGRVSFRDNSSIPVSLVWTLTSKDFDHVTCCHNRTEIKRKVVHFNGTALDTWICNQRSVLDNPYLIDGCEEYDCRNCTNRGGYCNYDYIYDVDGSLFSLDFSCVGEKTKQSKRTMSLGVILVSSKIGNFSAFASYTSESYSKSCINLLVQRVIYLCFIIAFRKVKEMSGFSTDQVFKSREELMEWVRKTGRSLGYAIVTKRSKAKNGYVSKVVLMCDRGGVYKSDKDSSRETGTRKINCPFEKVGKFSKKNGSWTLKVRPGEHNHPPGEYMEGHPILKRLTPNEHQLLAELTGKGVFPKDILGVIKERDENNVSTIKNIYNARDKIRATDHKGKSLMEVLMSHLNDKGYTFEISTNRISSVQT
ncbi:hypothetical protein Hdeb2414_s0013g00413341 [Helianthus debilis subsp. tardiflorus]